MSPVRRDVQLPRLDAFEHWLLDGAVDDFHRGMARGRADLLITLRSVTGPARSVAVSAIRSLGAGRDDEALALLYELLARGAEEED